MITKTLLLGCISLTILGSTHSISLNCEYSNILFGSLGTIYHCDVQNSLSIESFEKAKVDFIAGFNNDNVVAISIFDKGKVHYFPRGIEIFFKNLKGIQIARNELQHVHQSDLKPFFELKSLCLQFNLLEILENDLFKFNPKLEYIDLQYNEIIYINSRVFDNLPSLSTLSLESNICIKMDAWWNQTAVQNVIKATKVDCLNSDISELEKKVLDLEIEVKNSSLQEFKDNLEKLENQVKSSIYSNIFNRQVQDLKAAKDSFGTTTADQEFTTMVPEKVKPTFRKTVPIYYFIRHEKIKNDLETVKSENEAFEDLFSSTNNHEKLTGTKIEFLMRSIQLFDDQSDLTESDINNREKLIEMEDTLDFKKQQSFDQNAEIIDTINSSIDTIEGSGA